MHGAPKTACLLGIALSLFAAHTAFGNADAYQSISERNVFGLRAPGADKPPEPPPPPPNKITLTRNTTLL